jgi:hypothetical protein
MSSNVNRAAQNRSSIRYQTSSNGKKQNQPGRPRRDEPARQAGRAGRVARRLSIGCSEAPSQLARDHCDQDVQQARDPRVSASRRLQRKKFAKRGAPHRASVLIHATRPAAGDRRRPTTPPRRRGKGAAHEEGRDASTTAAARAERCGQNRQRGRRPSAT